MLRYLAGRLLQGATIVFAVVTFTFLLLQLAEGDAVDAMAAEERIPAEIAEQIREKFGLSRSLPERYARYIWSVAHGDLGHSYHLPFPVWSAIKQRIPATLALALAALLIDFTLGMTLGVVQGIRFRTGTDDVLSLITLTLFSIPVFWLGLMLVLVFALGLGWLPPGGIDTPWYPDQLPYWTLFLDHARHLILPATTLGLIGAASTARFQRTAMIEAVKQEFVRTARAKGLPENLVVLRHALRNALLPTITLFGLSFPVLLSGAVMVEEVFSWPGLGRLAVDAFRNRDYPLVTGTAIVVAVMVVLGNIIADLLYQFADPRTRQES